MGAVPKRRISKQRKNNRRSHHSISITTLTECSKCKKPKLPHQVCKNCGYYNDKEVIKVD